MRKTVSYQSRIGTTVGNWRIIGIDSVKNHIPLFICQCVHCGQENIKSAKTVLNSNSGKKCMGCYQYGEKWTGYGQISGHHFYRIKCNATARNHAFKINIEYLWHLYLQQHRKCAISGVDIHFKCFEFQKKSTTASLDRIDSKIGYVEGNVQWVHKVVNKMKNTLNQDEFVEWCNCIAQHNQ